MTTPVSTYFTNTKEIMHEENFYTEAVEALKITETKENLFDCLINYAEGHYLYDINGRQYLDLTSNNDNMPLGFSVEKKPGGFFDSLALKSVHASTLENLVSQKTGLERALFFAQKQQVKDFIAKIIDSGSKESVLISSLSKCWSCFPQKNTVNIPLNDESSVRTFLNKNTAAVIIELVQVNGSLYVANDEFLALIKKFCVKNNVLLIYDTTSVSPLRLNKGLFNFDEAIKPDIIIASKGLTSGNSLYVLAADNNIIEKTETVGLSQAFSSCYEEAIGFIQNFDAHKAIIAENIAYIEQKFEQLANKHIAMADIIPYGMLYALVTEVMSNDLVKAAFEKGLILKPLNAYTVLFCPPYNISKEQVDKVIDVFNELFEELTRFDRLTD